MTGPAILLLLVGLGAIAWVSARARAMRLQAVARTTGRRDAVHSLPGYHGWYVALWTLLPAAIFLIIWANVSPSLVTQAVLTDPAAQTLPANDFTRSAILGEARAIASGRGWAASEHPCRPPQDLMFCMGMHTINLQPRHRRR